MSYKPNSPLLAGIFDHPLPCFLPPFSLVEHPGGPGLDGEHNPSSMSWICLGLCPTGYAHRLFPGRHLGCILTKCPEPLQLAPLDTEFLALHSLPGRPQPPFRGNSFDNRCESEHRLTRKLNYAGLKPIMFQFSVWDLVTSSVENTTVRMVKLIKIYKEHY